MFTELYEAVKDLLPSPVAFAEEDVEDSSNVDEDKDDDSVEDEEEDDDDDDDDDDEEEAQDPLDELKAKYTETICHSFKHHLDECVARVTAAKEQEGYEDLEYKEDCVEEFFHLEHCLNENIAPVLFAKLR
ncbi:ubiquinol--cytochrome-c reductase subunit 6 [Starmerella bacillaris]|uniref:Ubiquinol--cytochrome-c reductase subunit 6 n=1 Tax=Starmerella bacillaris TaxID=1247836 RepID=A0AAV5RLL1_STABA|nr:ubiquinol--cytochrome-c reductase subunit 6 [Starmerella bacillaris]